MAQWDELSFYNIKYMQDMTPTVCNSVTTPSASATTLDTTGAYKGNTSYVPSTTLIDIRDNNTYTVRKLADGKCWMTQELRIVGKTITSIDSNVSSSYTIPNTASGFTSSASNTVSAATVYNNYGFYTYNVATAGSGTSLSSGNAPYSICPKGWKLPSGGTSSSIDWNITNDYYNLFYKYGATSTSTSYPKIMSTPLDFKIIGECGYPF